MGHGFVQFNLGGFLKCRIPKPPQVPILKSSNQTMFNFQSEEERLQDIELSNHLSIHPPISIRHLPFYLSCGGTPTWNLHVVHFGCYCNISQHHVENFVLNNFEFGGARHSWGWPWISDNCCCPKNNGYIAFRIPCRNDFICVDSRATGWNHTNVIEPPWISPGHRSQASSEASA
jgi:hypothetical protein